MKGISIIPDKIKTIRILSGVTEAIDSKGANCTIKPRGGDVYISLNVNYGDESMLIKDGETFDFCGKIYVSASFATDVSYIFYHTL